MAFPVELTSPAFNRTQLAATLCYVAALVPSIMYMNRRQREIRREEGNPKTP